ncbi:MAG: glycoside hydrolase family 127 protein, partial [Pseudobutyrivibrio sp.]|nr:glycoside hydrolase family 127 protein [Pseudobutyrivibrio sp.]
MLKNKLQIQDIRKCKINDAFWNKYTSLVTREIIPYQWKALNDEIKDASPSHCIRNFRIAAGLEDGDFEGFVFQDTDLAKWLEAVAFSLSYEPDDKLEKIADEAIDLIGLAQEDNGYLDTYFSIKYPNRQFCNLKEGHELYTAGHFIEAAVAYYKVTGKKKLLNIMIKCADNICREFHTNRLSSAVPGHEEIELALMKLYEVTEDKKYADMAYDFINRRGTNPEYLSGEARLESYIDVWKVSGEYLREYSQTQEPVREQTTVEGHAVRAVYLLTAMADLAIEYQDEALFEACERLYNNIVEKRMYITGGIGSSGTLERFTTDYDLPNDTNYSESCASIGLAMFCRRMLQITADAKYADTMERALMNTMLAGVAMDGKNFFYVNPLEVWPQSCMESTDKNHVKAVRQKWFGCACCPPNIARTLAGLGEYVLTYSNDTIYINMYVNGNFDVKLSRETVHIEIEGNYSWNDCKDIKIKRYANGKGQVPDSLKIKLRIPDYMQAVTIIADGDVVSSDVMDGYETVEITRDKAGVLLKGKCPPKIVYSNTNVRANIGKCAIVRGPLVYCLEQEDNGENLASLYIDTRGKLVEEYT